MGVTRAGARGPRRASFRAPRCLRRVTWWRPARRGLPPRPRPRNPARDSVMNAPQLHERLEWRIADLRLERERVVVLGFELGDREVMKAVDAIDQVILHLT